MTETQAISVFLVEDHELVQRGMRQLFENAEGIDLVGTAGTIAEAIEKIHEIEPDVLLLDLRLPDGLGTEVVKGLNDMENPPRSLILTSYAEDSLVLEAMSANVNGYILKDVAGEELIEAIRKTHEGVAVYASSVSGIMASLVRGDTAIQDQHGKFESLSNQELRVLSAVSEGKSNKQVALELNLSEKTVKNYLSNILSKLGYSSRTEAAVNFIKRNQKA